MYARTNGRNYGASPRPGRCPSLARNLALRLFSWQGRLSGRCTRDACDVCAETAHRFQSGRRRFTHRRKKPKSIHLRPLKMDRSHRNVVRRINIAEITREPGLFLKRAIDSRFARKIFRHLDFFVNESSNHLSLVSS